MKSLTAILIAGLAVSGCSIKKMAVNSMANSLSEGGSVYSSDEDPDLVREALPFGLKTFESLLETVPEHEGLLLATASGFSSYAYLLLQEADRIDAEDFREAQRLRARASKLFQRGSDYAYRGLDLRHPGFSERIMSDRATALAEADVDDVGFLYWAGAGLAGGLSADKNNTDLMGALPIAGDLVGRALELDETYDDGALHEFFISYEASRPGGDLAAAREHYARALELSKGEHASVYLALAESISVQEQNLKEFQQLLDAALAVDPDAVPELRLVNTMSHRRAEWLKERIPDLFLVADEEN